MARRAVEKAELLAEATKLCENAGFSLAEVVNPMKAQYRSDKRRGPKGKPKYIHPEDPNLTWTGRGRKPNWMIQLEREGITVSAIEE